MSNEIYIDDVGTEILIDMGVDISTASVYTIKVQNDNGETTWSPSIYDSNYLRYILQSDDLSVAGTYYLQPYLELPAWQGHGKTVNFKVLQRWN